MYTRTDYKLAQDWVMMCTVTQSMFKSEQATELKYMDPSLSADKLVQAYAIAFAPISLGLIRCPDNFLKTMEQAISESASIPAELPGEYSDAVKNYTSQLYKEMCERQEKRDKQATDAIKELGTDVASLGTSSAKKDTTKTDTTKTDTSKTESK